MALEDFASSEVGIAVAATALIASPTVRRTARKGLVYGLAGIMRAGDLLTNTARGIAQNAPSGAQSSAASASDGLSDVVKEAKTVARGAKKT